MGFLFHRKKKLNWEELSDKLVNDFVSLGAVVEHLGGDSYVILHIYADNMLLSYRGPKPEIRDYYADDGFFTANASTIEELTKVLIHSPEIEGYYYSYDYPRSHELFAEIMNTLDRKLQLRLGDKFELVDRHFDYYSISKNWIQYHLPDYHKKINDKYEH